MSNRCTVCLHPARMEIDTRLVAGESCRSIAASYPDLNYASIFRHGKRHMTPSLLKAAQRARGQDDAVEKKGQAPGSNGSPKELQQLPTVDATRKEEPIAVEEVHGLHLLYTHDFRLAQKKRNRDRAERVYLEQPDPHMKLASIETMRKIDADIDQVAEKVEARKPPDVPTTVFWEVVGPIGKHPRFPSLEREVLEVATENRPAVREVFQRYAQRRQYYSHPERERIDDVDKYAEEQRAKQMEACKEKQHE